MEGKYIFAIIILGLFFLMMLISFAFVEYGRRKEEKLQIWIRERYSDKEVNKFDYDTVAEDDVSARSVQDYNEKVAEKRDEILEDKDNVQLAFDDEYDKFDMEGIEEITGNYDGNK